MQRDCFCRGRFHRGGGDHRGGCHRRRGSRLHGSENRMRRSRRRELNAAAKSGARRSDGGPSQSGPKADDRRTTQCVDRRNPSERAAPSVWFGLRIPPATVAIDNTVIYSFDPLAMGAKQMGEVEQISALIGDIYDASLDPALWPCVLERACCLMQSSAAAIMTYTSIPGDTALSASWNAEEYANSYGVQNAINPLNIPTLLYATPGSVLATADVLPYENSHWFTLFSRNGSSRSDWSMRC